MGRKFHVRSGDRRKTNEPVSVDRRQGARRTDDERKPAGGAAAGLQAALRSLESLLERIRGELAAVIESRNPEEVTQIPTRNSRLAEAVRLLSEAQASLLELVRAAQAAARLDPQLREWVRDVAGHAAEVEEALARHMAERLHIDPPEGAPRARRFATRLERLLAS